MAILRFTALCCARARKFHSPSIISRCCYFFISFPFPVYLILFRILPFAALLPDTGFQFAMPINFPHTLGHASRCALMMGTPVARWAMTFRALFDMVYFAFRVSMLYMIAFSIDADSAKQFSAAALATVYSISPQNAEVYPQSSTALMPARPLLLAIFHAHFLSMPMPTHGRFVRDFRAKGHFANFSSAYHDSPLFNFTYRGHFSAQTPTLDTGFSIDDDIGFINRHAH